MFIYAAILILLAILPAIILIYVHNKPKSYYSKKQESLKTHLIIMIIISVLGIILFFSVLHCSFMHKEVRNYYITMVSHQERYSKKIQYTQHVVSGVNSKGQTQYKTIVKYRTDYYGPYYNAHSSSGHIYSISKNEYDKWKTLWGNEQHVNTIRGTSSFGYASKDGKYFETNWNNNISHVFPKPEIHRYKNVLRNSNSVFGFKYGGDIIHPVDKGNINGVISELPLNSSEVADFANLNAFKGGRHQIHIITYITYNKANNALEIVKKWGGLNKNELVVFIGVDKDRNIIWTDTHSWMENTKCQNIIRDQILILKKFNSKNICKVYDENLKYWKRKEFKDFNYIQIQIPISCIIIFALAVIGEIIMVGVTIFNFFIKEY